MVKKADIIWTREYSSSGRQIEEAAGLGAYAVRKIAIDGLSGETLAYEVSHSPKRTSWYRHSSLGSCKSWASYWSKRKKRR